LLYWRHKRRVIKSSWYPPERVKPFKYQGVIPCVCRELSPDIDSGDEYITAVYDSDPSSAANARDSDDEIAFYTIDD